MQADLFSIFVKAFKQLKFVISAAWEMLCLSLNLKFIVKNFSLMQDIRFYAGWCLPAHRLAERLSGRVA